jgi:signal transduction histidine kinase
LTSKTVLNVDDNAASRYLKSRTLREAGFKVVECGTGAAALEEMTLSRPDLVLLDIKLPDISGLEVCRRIKGSLKTSRVPVVHISAHYISDNDEVRGLEAGADIYLAEPVGAHALVSAVRTLLKLRATENGLASSEERMRLATEGAGIATWDCHLGKSADVWSRQFYAMLGYAPEAGGASSEVWLARVRSDEREAVAAALDATMAGQGPFSTEHWIVRADDGRERRIAPYGNLHMDGEGNPTRLLGVAMDVTDRFNNEIERETLLAQAREGQRSAEAAANAQDEFLAVLSHEMRTPMSIIIGWLSLLRGGQLSAERQATALQTIEHSAHMQVGLINDLLDVSSIVLGKMQIASETTGLDVAVNNAVAETKAAADVRKIVITADFDTGPWTVTGDPERLQQIFGNLLSNAVKFTPRGGRVRVSIRRSDGGVAVTIADNGEGIAAELLPHIFERFRQADTASGRRHGGMGLGLALVRSLISLHEGTVSAQSEGVGLGARFTVWMPLLPGDSECENILPGLRPSTAKHDHMLQGVRILVVEDNPDAASMLAILLQFQGATTEVALLPSQALDIAGRWQPDVMLVDIGLPEMNGYTLLPLLRKELGARGIDLPAVALTGFSRITDVAHAKAAGFQAHVVKPYDIDALSLLVAELCGGSSQNGPRPLVTPA